MIKKFNIFFITFLSAGKVKYGPGTFASLIACLIFFVLNFFFNFSFILIVLLIIFSYSFVAINNSFEEFDEDDPNEIVIDEVVGQILVLLGIPIYETLFLINELYYYIGAFILFRIFDVWKPYPINYVDNNVKGALGIMLDDVLAAIYSMIILIIFFFFIGG